MKKIFAVLALVTITAGCQSTYFKTMEKFGIHKRDILVDRVENTVDAQEETKEQFISALEKFSALTGFDGGNLQQTYDTLNKEYKDCEKSASDVKERISEVESVAEALFDEWELELRQYSSSKLRESSKNKLEDTKKRYSRLISAMKKAESRIAPVLTVFNDQVLYLKHNLNANAISSLQGELDSIEKGVRKLIEEMEIAIKEADSFIKEMEK